MYFHLCHKLVCNANPHVWTVLLSLCYQNVRGAVLLGGEGNQVDLEIWNTNYMNIQMTFMDPNIPIYPRIYIVGIKSLSIKMWVFTTFFKKALFALKICFLISKKVCVTSWESWIKQ